MSGSHPGWLASEVIVWSSTIGNKWGDAHTRRGKRASRFTSSSTQTATSYSSHLFLVIKSRMEMRVLYHLGSVQQDVRRRILPTSIEGHDLAHGYDRDLVVCESQIARLHNRGRTVTCFVSIMVLANWSIVDAPGLTIKLPPILLPRNPILLGRLTRPSDIMPRIGRVAFMSDDRYERKCHQARSISKLKSVSLYSPTANPESSD